MRMHKHNFYTLLDGTTIRGSHLHVYKCVVCGCYDVKIEGSGAE